jgi:ABC-type uncharacterized transport system substrate-binding protein
VVVTDAMYFTQRAKLQELIQTTRLPVAHALREPVIAGGLLSYGADLAANYRHAAKYVDKILKGAKPADLPVAHFKVNEKQSKSPGDYSSLGRAEIGAREASCSSTLATAGC